ncbi:MAG: glucose-1-phosphate thymidylyltransferase [Bacteroidetes bacterium]|nr:glucose-1-phosphate thymidylyltransferase [Bacteroidota bacterium]
MTAISSFVLFDTPARDLLHPFTYTRAIAEIRIGILTIKERWELLLNEKVQVLTEKYLQDDYTANIRGRTIFINAAVFPDENMLKKILGLQSREMLQCNNIIIAFCTDRNDIHTIKDIRNFHPANTIDYNEGIFSMQYPWQLTEYNAKAIGYDFQLLTKGRISNPVSSTNRLIAAEQIFIEEGATVEHCIINASGGPVYIGHNAVLMEGSMIRGPFAVGEEAVLKMGATIYGATTIGPYCIAGGEIKNSIMMGYSNKAHFGYLGDAVIGEWCNLGAGTSNSNVKNNASDISIEIPGHGTVNAGLKCGLMMGDYSRSAIHTSFNTATFAGAACNIFGEGFPPKKIPNFSWGYSGRYDFDKAITHIQNWKKLKNQTITTRESGMLEHLYKQL